MNSFVHSTIEYYLLVHQPGAQASLVHRKLCRRILELCRRILELYRRISKSQKLCRRIWNSAGAFRNCAGAFVQAQLFPRPIKLPVGRMSVNSWAARLLVGLISALTRWVCPSTNPLMRSWSTCCTSTETNGLRLDPEPPLGKLFFVKTYFI